MNKFFRKLIMNDLKRVRSSNEYSKDNRPKSAPIYLKKGNKFKKIKSNSDIIVIFTDGACKHNNQKNDMSKRKAGYGIYYGKDDPRNISAPLLGEEQTNNRAELQAIIYACETNIENRVEIHTDSQYCKDVITKYMNNWKKRGWRKADNKLPKNLDMVKRIYKLVNEDMDHTPRFFWVKGHSTNQGNNEADRLANLGVTKHLD